MEAYKQRISELFVKYSLYALVIVFVALVILGIGYLAVPIFLSLLLYYIFVGIVDTTESYGYGRVSGIIIVFLILGVLTYVLSAFVFPPVFEQLQPLLGNWEQENSLEPKYKYVNLSISIQLGETLTEWSKNYTPQDFLKKGLDYAFSFLKNILDFLPTLLSYMILTPIITFFLLLDAKGFRKTLISVVPNRFFEMALMVIYKVNEQITNYLKSLVIQGVIMTFVVGIGFWIVGLEHGWAFALFVGVANSIPYLGPLLGAIPSVIYVLVFAGGYPSVWAVLGCIGIGQLIDNVFTQPAIIAKSVSLHPIEVLIGIAVFGQFLGIPGMFIAVPAVSILKVLISILFKSLREHKLL